VGENREKIGIFGNRVSRIKIFSKKIKKIFDYGLSEVAFRGRIEV
jgi:hypothetical protein